MAKAVFHEPFNFSSRKRNVGWGVKASEAPQTFPEELVAAAVAAGAATRVPPRRKAKSRSNQGESDS